MANLKFGNTNIGKISIIEPYEEVFDLDTSSETSEWVRPDYWLDMPEMSGGDERVALLLSFPSGGHSSIRIDLKGTYINGSYSDTYSPINWGDGTSGILQGRANADLYLEHTYNWEDLNPSSEYVENGFTYRQTLVDIDNSVSGCHFLDLIRLGPNLTQDGASARYGVTSRLIELNIASDTMTGLRTYYSSQYPLHKRLERVKIVGNCQVSPYKTFHDCHALQSLELDSGVFTGGTNASNMFYNCRSLKQAPFFSTSHIDNMSRMFQYCFNLETVPEYDTSNVTHLNYMFNRCYRLKSVPKFDHSSANYTNYQYEHCYSLEKIHSGIDYSNVLLSEFMYNGCYSLKYVPSDFFSTMVNSTGCRALFNGCISLESIPPINLPSAQDVSSIVGGCRKLKEVEVEDISKVTDSNYGMSSMFSTCRALRKVTFKNPEQINASNMESMFYFCDVLEYAPYFNTSSGVRMRSMFQDCYNLENVPTYDLSSCTGVLNMFSNNHKLKRFSFKNVNPELTNYRSMGSNCYSLKEFPSGLFTNGSQPKQDTYRFLGLNYIDYDFTEDVFARGLYMFENHYGLKSVENFRPSGNCQFMFRYCSELRRLGDLDFTHVTDLTNWLYGSVTKLEWSDIKNVTVDHSYNASALSSGAIENVLNNLPTVASAKTVTFSNCWGAQNLHPDTIAIATAKGWTVTT